MSIPKQIEQLSEAIAYLPGIGPRMSKKIALYLSISNKKLANKIKDSLQEVITSMRTCDICHNITSEQICEICEDNERDSSKILIVENPLDLYSIEETEVFKGNYHVLHGVISPVNGIGPDNLTIDSLLNRVKAEEIQEVILALNPTIEGESTNLFISNELKKINPEINITQLAKGIPSGGNLEYMSLQTIADSLESRGKLE